MEQQFFKLNNSNIITPEQRASVDTFLEPVKFNFKFFIDFNSKKGLFASESNVNSALAYLKRIGQDTRYELLKKFIAQFKILLKEYEYLFLNVEGLENIQTAILYQNFGEKDDKLTFKIAESLDFKWTGLMLIYKNIIFDSVRNVRVIPKNLTYFDSQIFLFNAGYYNSIFYGGSEKDIMNLLFPTKEKLKYNQFEKMNHIVFSLNKCELIPEELNKNMFGEISNLMDNQEAFGNLTFRYNFANVDGRFNNTVGNFNMGALLALDSVQKQTKIVKKEKEKTFLGKEIAKRKRIVKERAKLLEKQIKHLTSKEFAKQMTQQLAKSTIRKIRRNNAAVDSVFGAINDVNSFIIGDDAEYWLRNQIKNIELSDTNTITGIVKRISGDKGIDLQSNNVYDGTQI